MNTFEQESSVEDDQIQNDEQTDQEQTLEVWVKPAFKSMALDQAAADPYGYGSGPTY